MGIILILVLMALFLLINRKETYSDYHVNYPFDAYPEKFGTGNDFLVKLPYNSLSTRHYKKMYHNKSTPKCVLNGSCDSNPGYWKDYPGYFDDPSKLKSYYLGYSLTGYPYNDYKFDTTPSKKINDLKHPKYSYEYSKWFDYMNPRKEAYYYGYPFYFHGKKMY